MALEKKKKHHTTHLLTAAESLWPLSFWSSLSLASRALLSSVHARAIIISLLHTPLLLTCRTNWLIRTSPCVNTIRSSHGNDTQTDRERERGGADEWK